MPEEHLEPQVREGEVIERPSATFTALQVLRLYRMEHASRLRNPCRVGPGTPVCVACARADVLLAPKA
jgi:hypothetical protein